MKADITYFEMIQISLEAMGAAFCIVCIIALFAYGKTKITKSIMKLLAFNTVMQISDSCAYIFRGNTDAVSLAMTRISNYLVFLMQMVMIFYFIRLTFDLLGDYGIKASKKFILFTNIAISAAFVLMTVNLFTGIAYYFDESNYYHRNTGWFIYTFIIIIVAFALVIKVLSHRKKINRALLAGLLVYILVPLFSGCFQAFFYGISLNSFSLTISLMAILCIYIRLFSENNRSSQNNTKSKKLTSSVIMLSMLIIILGTSVVFNIRGIQKIAVNLSKENTNTIFYKVKNEIENEFFHPLAVSDALAENVELKKLFDPKVTPISEDTTGEIVNILEPMYKAFGYAMMFAASDATKNYYTYENLSRTMDVENDPNDSWYNNFLSTNTIRELNVDTDKDNGMVLSVFINRLMVSDDGRTLGVCGVGIDMSSICDKIRQIEEDNNVKICFVNRDGLYMLCSDIDKIEAEYLAGFNAESISQEVSVIVDTESEMLLSAYIENMGWYLVMMDNDLHRVNVNNIIFFSILISVLGILLMSTVFWLMMQREKAVSDELEKTRVISYTDGLTGLGNRRGYDQEIFKIYDSEQSLSYIIVMMDVNGLKTVNDTLGHDAGDEMLRGAAECIRRAFSKTGNVYRTGGDEFAAILYCESSEMPAHLEAFNNETGHWVGDSVKTLSISLGWVSNLDYPDMSYDELERKADEIMYQNKADYYTKAGIDRRKY